MKWQIGGGGWPVGPILIPAGTIVEPPSWNGMTLPMPMPIDATPLDDDAALEMLKWYEPGHWHRLRGSQDEGGIDGQHSTPPRAATSHQGAEPMPDTRRVHHTIPSILNQPNPEFRGAAHSLYGIADPQAQPTLAEWSRRVWATTST